MASKLTDIDIHVYSGQRRQRALEVGKERGEGGFNGECDGGENDGRFARDWLQGGDNDWRKYT